MAQPAEGGLASPAYPLRAYLIYEAPFILSEAAFEFILAAGLVRGSKRINSADWMGSVFKTTRIPFFVTLALAGLAGISDASLLPGCHSDF